MMPSFPVSIYLLKVNNRNTTTRCEICSKSMTFVNFEHVNTVWASYCQEYVSDSVLRTVLYSPEAHSGSSQAFKMELFATIVDDF